MKEVIFSTVLLKKGSIFVRAYVLWTQVSSWGYEFVIFMTVSTLQLLYY